MGEVIRRVNASEKALVERLREYRPLIETYVQLMGDDPQVGGVPREDEYYLGKLDARGDLRTTSFLPGQGTARSVAGALRPPFVLRSRRTPDSFAAMAVLDRSGFESSRYDFRFVRREFLGDARCLVIDARPQGKRHQGFSGRLWVEDRDYTIVRFNGVNSSLPAWGGGTELHFDSWRLNLGPGLWLPAYIYTEEAEIGAGLLPGRRTRLKAQTRLWGYNLRDAAREDAFAAILVDDSSVQDKSPEQQGLSPQASQRSWELQAERNVLDRLEKAGLLAPAGSVDGVLTTVVNNLEVTNDIQLDSEVRCRVLLTSPLETFTVGRTIVMSRGLIDVLPDEASLATMLAHELGHILLGHQLIDTRFAFSDRMLVDDGALLEAFRFHRKPAEESAADAKALELLGRSPYKDKLGAAGLFLQAMASRARQLPNLIRPHFGDRIAKGSDILRLAEMMGNAPKLEAERTDQIAALPLGGRIQVDPWSGAIDLMRAKPVPIATAREKMPFEVTPFVPYVAYRDRTEPMRTSQKVEGRK
jgi:hypothetical protein